MAALKTRPTQASVKAFVDAIMGGLGGLDGLLAKLGKFKTGKSCLYIKRLSDVDVAVLEKLIRASVADMRRRYETD